MCLRSKGSFYLLILTIVLVVITGHAHSSGIQGPYAPWKFAVLSDTQGVSREKMNNPCINEPVLRAIAADVAAMRPDFVLVAGDLVSGWIWNGDTDFSVQYANWKSAMEPVYRANIPVFPVRGNHDVGPERIVLPPLPERLEPLPGTSGRLEQAFREAFRDQYIPKNGPEGEKGLTFSFFHKNAFIVGLDVCGQNQHRVNQRWLDKEFSHLKSRGGKTHVFVYAHEPAFELRHRDCLAYYRENRDRFWDSIGKAGGRTYFCGHDHLYNRAAIPDSSGNVIRQIVAGTGGGRLVKWSGTYEESRRVTGEYNNSGHHGYILVTVDGLRATVAWRALVQQAEKNTWQVLDSFSYTLP